MNKRTAIYLRVSTESQTVENQRAALLAWAQRNGYEITLTAEECASGADTQRPERQRVLDEARRGRLEAVAFWDMTRWSRSAADGAMTMDELHSLGVRVVAVNSGLDSSTPTGRMILGIMRELAEYERTLISERVKAGLRRTEAKGTKLGRPSVLVDVARMKELHDEGLSVRAIGRELGVSHSLVQRRLRRFKII